MDACILLLKRYSNEEPVNIGSGAAMSISDLANKIKSVIGYEGQLQFDNSKPDGMPEKVLDSGRLFELGKSTVVPFNTAIKKTYEWLIANNNRTF